MRDSFLNKIYCYGGELWRLGDIIIDLQKIMPNQKCIDRYLQGLLLMQNKQAILKSEVLNNAL